MRVDSLDSYLSGIVWALKPIRVKDSTSTGLDVIRALVSRDSVKLRLLREQSGDTYRLLLQAADNGRLRASIYSSLRAVNRGQDSTIGQVGVNASGEFFVSGRRVDPITNAVTGGFNRWMKVMNDTVVIYINGLEAFKVDGTGQTQVLLSSLFKKQTRVLDSLTIEGNDTYDAVLRFTDAAQNAVRIMAPGSISPYNLRLPSKQGAANSFVRNNGTGVLSHAVFKVTTTGTDFTISHGVDTTYFNLPDASISARGLVTTGAQTIAGKKTFNNNIEVGTFGGAGNGIVTFWSDGSQDANNLTIGNGYTGFGWTLPAASGTIALTTNSTFGSGSVWQGTAIDTTYTSAKVRKIVAGTNITISPTSGIGDVTINAGSGGITSLNTLTGTTQTFATGTTGTNFGISSSGTTHTFNIPDASTSARGLVTTGAQIFAGAKTFAGNITLGANGITSGEIIFYNVVPGVSGLLEKAALNGNRTWTLPDASGTIALTTNSTFGSGSVWQGTAIADTYIVSAPTWNAKATASWGSPGAPVIYVAETNGGATTYGMNTVTLTINGVSYQVLVHP